MAKNGFKIFDTDTHVGPVMEVLNKYLAETEKTKLAGWETFKSQNKHGHTNYTKGARVYRRRLGTEQPETTAAGYMAGFTGAETARQPSPDVDFDAKARIADMDFEG